uniref:Uncharacterized protein n=1 Tax=Tanacetum cinerariifolium TaxID=118510 RepID=A0A699HIE3_TANCI|nr:hypothetical protein [Tanacetum cinerariifolium]
MVEKMVCHLRKEVKIEVLTQMRKRRGNVSSSLDMSVKSCLGRMIVSLIFLERLEEETWVKSIGVEEKSVAGTIEEIVNYTDSEEEQEEFS